MQDVFTYYSPKYLKHYMSKTGPIKKELCLSEKELLVVPFSLSLCQHTDKPDFSYSLTVLMPWAFPQPQADGMLLFSRCLPFYPLKTSSVDFSKCSPKSVFS